MKEEGDGNGTHEDDLAEGTGGEEQVDPVLNLADLDVEARGDDTRLVQAAVELDDDLARAVVVDDLEVADVACRARLISAHHSCGRKQRCWKMGGMSSP